MRISWIKVLADGEQGSVEWNLGEKDIQAHREGKRHLQETLAPMFDLIDARLLTMNKRIMASNYLLKKLPADAQFAVNNVMDVMHGKADGPPVEAILKEREAEMEAARAQAERKQVEEEALLEQVKREMESPLQGSKVPGGNPAKRVRQPQPRPPETEVDPTIPGGV